MQRSSAVLPTLITVMLIAAMLAHGPIAQWQDYHRFADHRSWLGVANAADVLSNLPFALAGLWGLHGLLGKDAETAWGNLGHAAPAYLIFLCALLATAVGSAWYHCAPDDQRLVWDRLPIALACAGLLAAVRAESRAGSAFTALLNALGLCVLAIASVAWWAYSDDLRPYLLLQALPLLLIPLWQYQASAPLARRLVFGEALGCYVLAKGAELADAQILALGLRVSGHTLKHLLAALAAALIVAHLRTRVRQRHTRLSGLGYPRAA
ncbi:hypothetical protein IGB42_00874 [Andreprevotia sp. IGB-42]|uniref:hypothetical protein n=1 Tax=Andreprevotia sp. IGB-42 TaxID=2497473 RepID=UPI001359FFD3|nr:hypothetical protein [Andreprevotia sp. IGB-42]KAF0814819.1 hypothetical protein IGB42_00874 [Andreprevotia sp. IGB-42]